MTNVESGDLYNWECLGRSMTNVVLVNDNCATQTSRGRLLGIWSMTNVDLEVGDILQRCVYRAVNDTC